MDGVPLSTQDAAMSAGLSSPEAMAANAQCRVCELEVENARLRLLVSELLVENQRLRERVRAHEPAA